VLHVHTADPAVPMHVWFELGHAAGVPYARQPLLPRVQVARLPEMHANCPSVQLSLQVKEHSAFGAIPEHVSGLLHVEVETTYRHSSLSVAHVASVSSFSQSAPVSVQIVDVQVHRAVPPPPVMLHVW
jgi:hypothetical protein